MEELDFDDVYETLIGVRTLGHSVPGVENVFAPGAYCQQRYEEMLQYRERLWQRLDSPEDEDVEHILSAMESIQREVCRKLFEYTLTLNA